MSAHVMPAANLFDFFHERVEGVRAERAVKISNDTSLYLASLLADRTRADRPAPTETTLAELHMAAANGSPSEQARKYRELGDRALYLLGCFQESLSRTTVGPRYYADMGAAAYSRADRVFKHWFADAFGPVFGELSTRFAECVALVGEVHEATETVEEPVSDDPLWLYQRWMATGNESYARRLREKGLLLVGRSERTRDET